MNAQPDAIPTDAADPALVAAIAAAVAQQLSTRPDAGPALTRITVSEMADKCLDNISTSTVRTYRPYLLLLSRGWAGRDFVYPGIGDMYVDEVLPSHLKKALEAVDVRAQQLIEGRNAVRRKVGRVEFAKAGSTPRYNAVGAFRRMFSDAIAERHLAKDCSPAADIIKPHRSEGGRMALRQSQLDAMFDLVDSTGDDPELDRMVCETILVSAARVEGLLNLTVRGIDVEECVIWLDEKNDTLVPQPVPDWFAAKLLQFARSRGAVGKDDPVFVKRPCGGRPAAPITERRMDYIFGRLQAAYEWADTDRVTAHVLRHHAVTVVERLAGKAVARAYARHSSGDVNDIYTAASRAEVAAVVVRLYGGDHPWLHREPRVRKTPR